MKLAHRFDAPGCANHTEVAIRVEPKLINLSILCMSVSSKIKYVLDLPLWGTIIDESSTYKYEAVGKYQFTLTKENRPGRWPQLHSEDFPKPFNTRLHLEWHQMYANSLLNFGD